MKLQGVYRMLLWNGKGEEKVGLSSKVRPGPQVLWFLDPLLKFKMRTCKMSSFFNLPIASGKERV